MLRNRTLLVVCLALVSLLACLYILSRIFVLRGFTELETENTTLSLDRGASAVEDDLAKLDQTTRDYAAWDQTYDFLENLNPRYLRSEFPAGTLAALRVNVVAILDRSGHAVFEKAVDLSSGQETPMTESWRKHLPQASVFARGADPESPALGILVTADGPFLVSARPVLNSQGDGPIRGTFIMARALDATEMAHLAGLTHLSLSVYGFGDARIPADVKATRGSTTATAFNVVRPLNQESIGGYRVLSGVDGKPAIILRVEMPRTIYAQGQKSLAFFVKFCVVAGLLFSAGILILLERMVLSRVTALSAGVVDIGAQHDLAVRVPQKGSDELSKLGAAINWMLEALQRSQLEQNDRSARMQLMVDQLPAVLWTTDASLQFTSSLGAALAGLSLKPGQVVGLSVFEFFQSTDPDFLPIAAHRKALNGESVSYEQTWNERAFDAHVEPLRDPGGRIYGTVGIALDVTAHKIAEESLRQSREALQKSLHSFRSLVQYSSDVITILEADWAIRYESPSVERVFGWMPEEMLGRNIFEFIHPDDADRVRKAFYQRSGNIPGIEFRFRHKDGSWRVLEAMGNNLLHDSNVGGVVVNSRDITERRELEEQLRQAQKMEAIGQLAGGMAHDFNNLLTIIGGHNEILLERLGSDNPLRRNAQQVKEAADRASALIAQLLGFSRKQVVHPTVLDLSSGVSELGEMLLPLLGQTIHLRVAPAEIPCLIKADAVQIQQVVMNLAVNARDAMPTGGVLSIETSLANFEPGASPPCAGLSAGTYAVLTVKDTGCGMDAETRKRIFEPFFTTKEKGRGTGLGLSTVYGIVKQSGGHVAVDSKPGHGTTFNIYWPAWEGNIPELSAPPSPRALKTATTETILLVEDEEGIREMIREFLSAKGYEVLVAEDGLRALKICEASVKPIHLVLTDMSMPNMTGRELARRIGKQLPQTRILFMSGYTEESMPEESASAQSTFLITKPFTLDGLNTKVREVLNSRPQPPESPNQSAPNLEDMPPKSSSSAASAGE